MTESNAAANENTGLSGAEMLFRIVREGYGPGAWHGADLRAALADVTVDVAYWRPDARRHNIAEIAVHHAWTVHSAVQRLTGREPGPFVFEGEDWFVVNDAATLGWDRVCGIVAEQQDALMAAVRDIVEGLVESPKSPGDRFVLVLGATCHAVYHAGQIQLLKVLHG